MSGPVAEGVLRLLRDDGPRTRQQLADALGISRTSVGNEVSVLERAGLVTDGPLAPSSGGRPSGTVRLGPAVRLATVSVGESRTRAMVLDGSFVLPRSVTLEAGDLDADALRSTALEALDTALGTQRSVLAVGLALAPDLPGVGPSFAGDLATALSALAGGRPVVTEQAARALVRGERHGGVARRRGNLVAVRIGTTVTTAAYVDGHLGRGEDGLAGAVGHAKVDEFGPACVCGSSGCLDSFASVHAVREQALAAARSGRSPALAAVLDGAGTVRLPDVVAAAAAGDPIAVQMARDVGRRVGETVASLVAFANPSTVVVGGPVAALGPHLLNEVRGSIYRRAPARVVAGVQVELATPGDRGALLGAGLAASDRAFGLLAGRP